MAETFLTEAMAARLPPGAVRSLHALGELADRRKTGAYVVGGLVRDLLLDRDTYDLDVVVEEAVESFAQAAAAELDGEIKARSRFGTVLLVLRDGTKLDLATSRSEVYARPGALPDVRFGAIGADLSRRDFTINAMAIRLNAATFGALLDPHGGRDDLEHQVIRVLHEKSFEDDPTRILRAVRFEARLGFTLEDDTRALLLATARAGYLSRVSGERIRNEIELILGEPAPGSSVRVLDDWGILRAVAEGWSLPEQWERICADILELLESPPAPCAVEERWTALLAAMLLAVGPETRLAVGERLVLGRRALRIVSQLERLETTAGPALASADSLAPSEVRTRLDGFEPEILVLASAVGRGSPLEERIALYLKELRHVRPALTGDDLRQLGIVEGERIGTLLRALLIARLDGVVETRQDELSLARRLARELDDSGGN